MVSYFIIGETGAGKTYYSLELIEKYKKKLGNKFFCLVFDTNNTDFKNTPYWDFKTKMGIFRVKETLNFTIEHYLDLMLELKNCIFYIDEASTAVGVGQLRPQIRKAITQKRHTCNRIIFIYHQWGQTPPQLSVLCDYIVQFKTSITDAPFCKKRVFSSNPSIYTDKLDLDYLPKFSKKIQFNTELAKNNVI